MSHDQWSRDGETRSLLPRPSLDDGGDLVAPLRKPSSGSIYGLTALAAVSGFMFGYDTGQRIPSLPKNPRTAYILFI